MTLAAADKSPRRSGCCGARAAARVSLEDKVAFLRESEAYPGRPSRVECIETHMAWVFLAGERAYKLKKPVRNAFRDLRSLAARRQSCEIEVLLNTRLAAGVYLGVVPLVLSPGHELGLACPGRVADWLVEMRRLRAEDMLDHQLGRGTARERDVRAVGEKLARFYQRATRVNMGADRYRRRLARDLRATRRALARPRYRLPAARLDAVCDALLGTLHTRAALFDERVHARRVVDGHGDLRPEHVCLEPEPVIIDCIEFAADLRILDAVSDLSFLALECERLGGGHLGRIILDTYARETGDSPPEPLLRFYLGQHAYSRAKVAAWHLDDASVAEPARWLRKARQYLDMAERHACSPMATWP